MRLPDDVDVLTVVAVVDIFDDAAIAPVTPTSPDTVAPPEAIVSEVMPSKVPLLISTFVIACELKSIAPTAVKAPSFFTVSVSVANTMSGSPLRAPSDP